MHIQGGSSLFRIPVILFLFCLHACGGAARAPVEAPRDQPAAQQPASISPPPAGTPAPLNPPTRHVVRKGDTLYAIAWNYGLDFRDLASWNSINPPYVIYPGQQLELLAGSTPRQTTAAPQDNVGLTPGPIVIRKKTAPDKIPGAKKSAADASTAAARPSPSPSPAPAPAPAVASTTPAILTWQWPARGNIVKQDTPIAKNGINISGARGQQIHASAPGEVVYSGSGLLGYGRLIIIKHNEIFLSAYANNSELLVEEGDRVQGGQQIASMGEAHNGQAFLHFEIRKNGQPVDPLKYLPPGN